MLTALLMGLQRLLKLILLVLTPLLEAARHFWSVLPEDKKRHFVSTIFQLMKCMAI